MKYNIKTLAFVIGMCFLSVNANAQTIVGFYFSDWTTNTKQVVIGGKGYYAGLYGGSLNGQATNFYCSDMTHTIYVPGGYNGVLSNIFLPSTNIATQASNNKYYYSINNQGAGLDSAFSKKDYNVKNGMDYGMRLDIVSWLSQGISDTSANAYSHAARQLAIWNVIQDGDLDMSSINNESTLGTDTYILGLAQNYLNSYNGEQYSNVLWLQSGGDNIYRNNHTQDMLFLHPETIPETNTLISVVIFIIMGIAYLVKTKYIMC